MGIDQVTDLPSRVQYAASAAQTDFDYPFPIFADSDLVVAVDGTTQTLNTDYTVSGEEEDTGGTVTFGSGMSGGEVVTIYRHIAIERLTDIQQNGPWSSSAYNDEQDKTYLLLKQLDDADGRALRIPVTAAVDDADIELTVANFADKYLTFDSDGKPTPAALSSTTMTQETIGNLLYPRTDDEITASVTPAHYYGSSRPWTDAVKRYGLNGDGVTDNTSAFTNMMAVAGQSLFIKRGDYVTGKFNVQNNTVLYLEPGTIIRDSGVLGANDQLINIVQKSNVHIVGWGAEVTMDRADYTTGEQRHGVIIRGGSNICIEGLSSNDSGGDGFIVMDDASDNAPANVVLRTCSADNNRRQGLSIIAGDGVTLDGGVYSGTTGTAPAAGIDIEPDDSGSELRGIKLRGVTTRDNDGSGIECALSNFVATASKFVDIEIIGHTSINDAGTAQEGGFKVTGNTSANWANKLYGSVRYNGAVIVAPGMSGVVANNWDASRAPLLRVRDVTVHNCGGSASNARDKSGMCIFAGAGTTMDACGNVEVDGLVVTDDRGTPLTYTGLYIENAAVPVSGWRARDVECQGFTPTVAANRDIVVLQSGFGLSNGRAYSSRNRSVTLSSNGSAISYMGRDAIIAGASIVVSLPDAQYCLGQEFKFVNGGAYTYQIRAAASNTIFYNGIAAAGDLNLFKQGDTAVLRATAAGTWTVEALVRGSRTGTAAPSVNATFIGELFVDTTNSKAYISKAIGGGAGDWMVLN